MMMSHFTHFYLDFYVIHRQERGLKHWPCIGHCRWLRSCTSNSSKPKRLPRRITRVNHLRATRAHGKLVACEYYVTVHPGLLTLSPTQRPIIPFNHYRVEKIERPYCIGKTCMAFIP